MLNFIKKIFIFDPSQEIVPVIYRAWPIITIIVGIISIGIQIWAWILHGIDLKSGGSGIPTYVILLDRLALLVLFAIVIIYLILRLNLVGNLFKNERNKFRSSQAQFEAYETAMSHIHMFHHTLRDCIELIDAGYHDLRSPGQVSSDGRGCQNLSYFEVRKASYNLIQSAITCLKSSLSEVTASKCTASIKQIHKNKENKPIIRTIVRDSDSHSYRKIVDEEISKHNYDLYSINVRYAELFDPTGAPWEHYHNFVEGELPDQNVFAIDMVWLNSRLKEMRPRTQGYIAIAQSLTVHASERLSDERISELWGGEGYRVEAVLYVDSDASEAFPPAVRQLLESYADALYKVIEYRTRYLRDAKPAPEVTAPPPRVKATP